MDWDEGVSREPIGRYGVGPEMRRASNLPQGTARRAPTAMRESFVMVGSSPCGEEEPGRQAIAVTTTIGARMSVPGSTDPSFGGPTPARTPGPPIASMLQPISQSSARGSRLTAHGSRLTGRGSRSGMTLVEVIVAMSLLGLLSAGLFTAFQVGVSSWVTTRERLMLDRNIAGQNQRFHALFAGIVPLEARVPPDRAFRLRPFPFFQGEPQSMRFVTSHSITAGSRGGLRITELQVVDAPGKGRRVLLNQLPYRGPFSAGSFVSGWVPISEPPGRQLVFEPIRALPNVSLIIADQLAACSFLYLERPRSRNHPSRWVSTWKDLDRLPGAITINLTPASREARLLPVSITTAVRAEYALPLENTPPLPGRPRGVDFSRRAGGGRR